MKSFIAKTHVMVGLWENQKHQRLTQMSKSLFLSPTVSFECLADAGEGCVSGCLESRPSSGSHVNQLLGAQPPSLGCGLLSRAVGQQEKDSLSPVSEESCVPHPFVSLQMRLVCKPAAIWSYQPQTLQGSKPHHQNHPEVILPFPSFHVRAPEPQPGGSILPRPQPEC